MSAAEEMPALQAQLPSTARAATTRTATAKSSEPAASAAKASATTVASSATATASAAKQKQPEKHPAKRRNKEDQQNDDGEKNHSSRRQPLPWPFLWLRWNFRTGSGERDAGVLCDDLGDSRGHQQQRAGVVVLPQQRNRLTAKSANFPVRQDWFQAVANFDPVFPVLHGQQDQDSMIGFLAADSPAFEQVDGVAVDIRTIQRIDGHDRDLRLRLLIDLLADVIQLRDGGGIENVGEIVDVVSWAQLGNGLSVKQERQRQHDEWRPKSISQTTAFAVIV